MKKIYSIPLAVILVFVTMLALGSSSTASADESKVLEFNYMVGLPRPFTGNSNAIRGVPGGGLPWVIDLERGNSRQMAVLTSSSKDLYSIQMTQQ